MGIDTLQLTPDLIALLYPETLITALDVLPAEKINGKLTEPASSAYPFLGNNKQSLCFLVRNPDAEFMSPDQQAFLVRMLMACKYSLEDIALINTAHQTLEWELLKKQLHPRIVFLWGTHPVITDFPGSFPDLEIAKHKETAIVPVYRAGDMIRDNPEAVELKKKLWVTLKKIFSL